MAIKQIKDFKLVKEIKNTSSEPKFIKNILIGAHPLALKLLKTLSQNEKEEVLLIHEFDFQDIFNDFHPRLIRGEKTLHYIKQFTTVPVQEILQPVKFLKDGELRDFGGRIKPHEIKPEEELFLTQGHYYNEDEYFEDLLQDQSLKIFHQKAFIKKIKILEANDLGAKENFQILLSDGEIFNCEYLYSFYSPIKTHQMLDKETCHLLQPDFFKFLNTLTPMPFLTVKFHLKGELTKEIGTILFPQSQTHEWGSFIVEFDPYNSKLDKQILTVGTFLTENEVADNEEISKKIRLMKRVIERYFENLEKKIKDEQISLNLDLFCTNFADFDQKSDSNLKYFKIIHPSGPMVPSEEKIVFSGFERLFFNYLS